MKTFNTCILFSTADWDTPYWTNKQHTTKHLASKGINVLYIESIGLRKPKLSSGVDLFRIWRRLIRGFNDGHQVEPGIWVISPLAVPFKHNSKIVNWVNKFFLKNKIKRFLHRHDWQSKSTLAWTYHPYILDYLDPSQYCSLAYHCVDDIAAVPGVDAKSFMQKEKILLNVASAVFATSEKLFHHCSAINCNTYFLPNVVDFEHFSKALDAGEDPADLREIPHPRLGYVGVLSDFKVDFHLILEIANAKPHWQIILIGEEREGQSNPILRKLKAIDNVHLLGYKNYSVLPDYMRGLDIGLLPNLLNAYTDAMYPMKYYEYIASGLRVVSTPLKFLGYSAKPINLRYQTYNFIASIEDQLKLPRLTLRQSIEGVGENTWVQRLEKMLLILSTS